MAEQSPENPAPNPLTDVFNPADWNLTDVVSSATNTQNQRIIGQVIMVARTTLPSSNWLFCDGTAYDTAQYGELFSVIGYTYGGSGGTFNVPNFLAKTPVGADATSALATLYASVPVVSGGNRNQSNAQLASHNHAITIDGGSFSYASSSNPNNSDRGNPSGSLSCVVNTGVGFSTSAITGSAGNTGGGADYLPPFVVINYCIRAN
jgi:microcystin-dependent protein